MPAMSVDIVVVVRDAVVVILLCHRRYSSSSLSLGMLMARVARVLGCLVALLLVQP